MAREKVTIPFGGGVDRLSGRMVAEPTSFNDIRNVHLRRGKAELRGGLLRVGTTFAGAAIVGVHSIRSRNVGAVLTYDNGTGHVTLWITDADGLSPVSKGTVMACPTGANPRLVMADAYDRLFIAHDEPDYSSRARTVIYNAADDNVGEDVIWDGAAFVDVKFRGVARHLNYIVGWGWGDESDPDRPETLRISMPGEPQKFARPHYFLVGARGDAIVKCDTVGALLSVRKDTEAYEMFGYDRSNFGVRPADMLFGQVSSRLSVVVGDRVYLWSQSGPRLIVGGGASVDLALPLDLGGPSPDVLANAIDTETAFAAYDADKREVLFIFGQWCYVLHLEEANDAKWSFRKFGVVLACAGIIYKSTVGALLVAEGWAEQVPGSWGTPDTFFVNPFVNLLGTIHGGETIQWYVKDSLTNTWALKLTTMSVPAAQPTWAETLTGLTPGMLNTVAARVRRAGRPMSAYTNANPDLWPSTSRYAQITPLGAPTITNVVAVDDGFGNVHVTITLGGGALVLNRAHIDFQVQYDGGGGYVAATVISTDRAAGTVTVDATAYYNSSVPFKVRQHTVDTDSPYSAPATVGGTSGSGSFTSIASALQDAATDKIRVTWAWTGSAVTFDVFTNDPGFTGDPTGATFGVAATGVTSPYDYTAVENLSPNPLGTDTPVDIAFFVKAMIAGSEVGRSATDSHTYQVDL